MLQPPSPSRCKLWAVGHNIVGDCARQGDRIARFHVEALQCDATAPLLFPRMGIWREQEKCETEGR
jgi:hypothetical protein